MRTSRLKTQAFTNSAFFDEQEGLRIGCTIQVYRAERRPQLAFSTYIAARHSSVLNIGYGLGYADLGFTQAKLDYYKIIEVNRKLAKRARYRSSRLLSNIITCSWEDYIINPENVNNFDAVYFDGFPIGDNFNYSHQDIQRYPEKYIEAVKSITKSITGYFITFHAGACRLPQPKGVSLKLCTFLTMPRGALPCNHTRVALWAVHK